MIYVFYIIFKNFRVLIAIGLCFNVCIKNCVAANLGSSNSLQPIMINAKNIIYDGGLAVELEFRVQDGWKVYAAKQGDAGVPLSIAFADQQDMESISIYDIIWPQPNKIEEKILGDIITSYIYDKNFKILIKIGNVETRKYTNAVLLVKYSACKNHCLMFEQSISITIPPNLTSNNTILQFLIHFSEILLIMLGAIMGGVILNFMPCVFPVLSMKFISIMKHGTKDPNLSGHLSYTAFGILTTFMLMAVFTIVLKLLGGAAGWGMHFQSPSFLIIIIIIMALVASNLWGDFYITLPNFLNDKLGRVGIKSTHLGSFFSGVIATLLATPCTAPFVATTMALALSQNFIIIAVTYFCMGLGMASPYILLKINPKILNIMPKPGAWMVYIQKAMAILVLMTTVWLIYILSHHFSIRALSIMVLAIILLRIIIIKTCNISITKRLSAIFSVILIAFILPYIANNKDHALDEQLESSWEKFDHDKLLSYLDENRIVLVDVTAEWCITCKINKLMVLENINVIDALKAKQVVLMRANYTSYDQKISDFLNSHSQHGIPFNILYSGKYKKGLPLPTILTPNAVMSALKEVGH